MEPINLSDGEWKLMEALWQNPPKTITQLTKELYEKTRWSKHTIITMLNRLEAKEAVRHEEGEKAKQFYPCIRREEAAAEETSGLLERVYNGSLGLMVNTLISSNKVSREELDELYQILEQAEEEFYD